MLPRRPNLFIIGAMKSGTSSLYRYLAGHPEIFASASKEPMYFSRAQELTLKLDDYLNLYENATDENYLMEGSTEYSKRPFRNGVAERIFDFNPEARFIYLMRDPFERIVSQYKHMVNREGEKRTLVQAIQSTSDYVTNSYYAYQLEPFIELFGRDAVFTGTFEAMIESPGTFCRDIFTWLGIEPDFRIKNVRDAYNVSPKKVIRLDESRASGRIARKLGGSTAARILVPESLRQWLKVRFVATTETDFTGEAFQQERSIAQSALTPILYEWSEELTRLTDLKLNQWLLETNYKQWMNSHPRLTDELRCTLSRIIG